MSLSASLSKVAAKVIKQFGVKCTFTRETESAFDPATGVRTTVDTTFTGYGVKDSYSKDEVNGTTVLYSDIKLILEKTGTVPGIDDQCAIGGVNYRVVSINIVDPDDVDIIYEVQLRS